MVKSTEYPGSILVSVKAPTIEFSLKYMILVPVAIKDYAGKSEIKSAKKTSCGD